MAILVVLWSYLLSTKLRCLQKNNFGHTKWWCMWAFAQWIIQFPIYLDNNVLKCFICTYFAAIRSLSGKKDQKCARAATRNMSKAHVYNLIIVTA